MKTELRVYFNNPVLLNDVDISSDVLRDVFTIASFLLELVSVELKTEDYPISKVKQVLINVAANPNTPKDVLKSMFQTSLKVFLGIIYFKEEPFKEQSDLIKFFPVLEYDGEVLKRILNNSVLPQLLFDNPNLVEEWLTFSSAYGWHLYNTVTTKKFSQLTMLLKYFNLDILLKWITYF